MDSGRRQPASGEARHDIVLASRDALARLAIPLTIVRGRAQLLQRRIHRCQTLETDDVLQALERIEEATRVMAAQLRALSEGVSGSSGRRDDTPPGNHD